MLHPAEWIRDLVGKDLVLTILEELNMGDYVAVSSEIDNIVESHEGTVTEFTDDFIVLTDKNGIPSKINIEDITWIETGGC